MLVDNTLSNMEIFVYVFFLQNEAQLLNLKKQLEDDAENLKAKTNVLNIRKVIFN